MPGRPAGSLYLIASTLLVGCVHGAADRATIDGPVSIQSEAMRPFDNWLGVWKGTGWVMREGGTHATFTRVERVERKVAGTVLLLEGESMNAGDPNKSGSAHQSMATIHYDDRARAYRWNGHDATRGATDAELKRVEGGVEWTLQSEDHAATVRFTIQLADHRWHEIGEVTTDGQIWNTFMEANLQRQD